MNLPAPMLALVERLTPRQRQYAMLGAILLGGVGLLWLVFAFAENAPSGHAGKASGATPGPVTNIGVMPPGQQVNPLDQWVGTAGSKLAQYESEREEQGRLYKDRHAFEARTMQRFDDLELRSIRAVRRVAAQIARRERGRRDVPQHDEILEPCNADTGATVDLNHRVGAALFDPQVARSKRIVGKVPEFELPRENRNEA